MQAAGNNVLSVSNLNRQVRECLETSFTLCWVGGEISNLTFAASGHVYFSLKDANAQARCVMWRSRAQLLGWRLENGHKVEARVLVSFYEPRGEFQLTVETVRRAGQGDLFERFLRLKAQLEGEGLFASERKRPLPVFPRHIALITSLQAAALRDVLSTVQRRAPHLQVTIFPTPVQGEGAAEKIAAAVNLASSSNCEAIILCRGGGSIEDLWAFNEECVARAICAAKLPLISGIGHETDFTIADFVADLRAPTPTAAAEILSSPDRDQHLAKLKGLHDQLRSRMERALAEQGQRLDWLADRLTHPAERIRQRQTDLNACGRRLGQALRYRHEVSQSRLNQLRQRLASARPQMHRDTEHIHHLHFRLSSEIRRQFSEQAAKLNLLYRGLNQLDPRSVLTRGYTLVIGPDGRAIRDATTLASGDRISLSFAQGSAIATINQVVVTTEAD